MKTNICLNWGDIQMMTGNRKFTILQSFYKKD